MGATLAALPANITSILFITLSNIGDCVLTTPVLQTLHQRFPQACFDIVTSQRSSELFLHVPGLRYRIHRRKQAGWREKVGWLRQLRRERYDLIVDLRTDGLSYLLRARYRCNKQTKRKPAGYHQIYRHFAVIGDLFAGPPPLPYIYLSAAEYADARAWTATLPGSRWLALGPGANWDAKIWPKEHYIALLEHVTHAFDAVLLLGGPGDRERNAWISTCLKLPHLDLSGVCSLLQSAAVLQQATVFVGNDSGLGHLASAVATPSLTLFGPGDPLRYHPWHPNSRWLQAPSGDIATLEVERVASELLAMVDESVAIP